MKWTRADDIASFKQGWGIFQTDDKLEILALDDPYGIAADYGYEFTGHVFKGPNRDLRARAYVRRYAKKGFKTCQKALEFVRRNHHGK